MKETLWSKGRLMMGSIAVVMATGQMAFAQLASTNWTREDGKIVVKFTAGSGTWTVPKGIESIEVLVVGGGGAGGIWGSGGGAGGLCYKASYSVTAGNGISIGVGVGGTGTANGGKSQFDQILAFGGQSFAPADSYRPMDEIALSPLGVHGGHQGGYSTDGGSTTNAGNLGGGFYVGFDGAFSSGGGAGAPGDHGNGTPGGAGTAVSITGSSEYYAGGGGTCVGGLGGLGGGGNGNSGGGPGDNGTDGLGGGGGGGLGSVSSLGGSGIVIIAYQPPPPPPLGTLIILQ